MANVKKELTKIRREAAKQGWRVEETKNGWKLYSPDGQHLEIMHRTPGDSRTVGNTVSRMRKHGFVWKGH